MVDRISTQHASKNVSSGAHSLAFVDSGHSSARLLLAISLCSETLSEMLCFPGKTLFVNLE